MRKTIVAALMAVFCLSSCTTTQYASNERVRTDTVYISKTERVTDVVRDSVLVWSKADTIYVYKTKTRYVDRIVADTVYRAQTDTIVVTREVVKDDPLRQMRHTALEVLLVLVVVALLYLLIKRE